MNSGIAQPTVVVSCLTERGMYWQRRFEELCKINQVLYPQVLPILQPEIVNMPGSVQVPNLIPPSIVMNNSSSSGSSSSGFVSAKGLIQERKDQQEFVLTLDSSPEQKNGEIDNLGSDFSPRTLSAIEGAPSTPKHVSPTPASGNGNPSTSSEIPMKRKRSNSESSDRGNPLHVHDVEKEFGSNRSLSFSLNDFPSTSTQNPFQITHTGLPETPTTSKPTKWSPSSIYTTGSSSGSEGDFGPGPRPPNGTVWAVFKGNYVGLVLTDQMLYEATNGYDGGFFKSYSSGEEAWSAYKKFCRTSGRVAVTPPTRRWKPNCRKLFKGNRKPPGNNGTGTEDTSS